MVGSQAALVARIKVVLARCYVRTPERGRGTGRYAEGWNDRRVAAESGAPSRVVVAEVRQHLMD